MTFTLHTLHVPGADPARDEIVDIQRQQTGTRVCLHLDPERRGVVPTWLEALDCAARADEEWSVVIQDDALPLLGWQAQLPAAAHHSPSPALGLTHFGTYGAKALAKNRPYAVGPNLIWGGAVAYHRAILRPLAAWSRRQYNDTGFPHDDVLVPAWLMAHSLTTALAARALFDQPVTQSLLGHNTAIRRPSTTIVNTPHLAWSTRPPSLRVSRTVWPDLKEMALRP
jgi:hypothetical protein